MNRASIVRLLAASAATVATAAVLVAAQAIGARDAHRPGAEPLPEAHAHWVHTWTAMPQLTEPGNLPPAPFTQPGPVMADTTLRQTIRVTVGTHQLRLRFSNAFGDTVLPLTAVSLALPAGGQPGVSAIQPGSSRPVTFHGRPSVRVPPGAQVVSDPMTVDLPARSNLTVTTYLAAGQASNNITSHPGSRTTSYLINGNRVGAEDLPGATPVNHWYFLSGAETLSPNNTAGVVMLGDSLTDGRGSTTNQNNRWPDQLLDRLQSKRDTADIAVLNQAAGGNRVLNDGLGPNALARLDRDVLAQSGVKWLIVFEGVNDIGTAAATEPAQHETTDSLIAAYDQIILRAHAAGLRVYGATLLPFGGNTGYDDPAGLRETARQTVNRWIRTSHQFDAIIDFDLATRDPANPRQLLTAYDDGDHLHLNPTGYKALADTVPAHLFR